MRTWEGWLYLAAVQDAYSRRIVGWSMADHMRSELVADALTMAFGLRRPAPGVITTPTKAGNTCLWGSGSNARRPGSPGRWAPPASAGITPSPRRSSRPSRRSWSTANPGRPAAS
ncbi:MAG: DDE-type integrase/transposase/recombinase [Solirubrobacteraceae bacterium]